MTQQDRKNDAPRPVTTVLHRLSSWANETPLAPAQRFKKEGRWQTISAREYCDRVFYLAHFLKSRGFNSSHVSAIFSYNSPEWVHMDLASLLLGAKSAGLYPNSNKSDIHYILNHTQARVLGIQNKEYFQKFLGADADIPSSIDLMIVFDGDTSIHPKAVAYEAAITEGRKLATQVGAKKLEDLLNAVDAKAGAFMIYTSGTTGNPKGALLSHDNLAYTSDLVAAHWRLPFSNGELFSFLPLCHIAEKLQNIGVGITNRYCVNFATRFENLSTEILEVRPTLLLSVPRLYEKMMEGVLAKIKGAPAPRQKLARWALEVAKRVSEAKYSHRHPNLLDLAQLQIADKLVLSKIRIALGLDRAEMLASGAAALPGHVNKWFRSLGLEILEDFGQTESTGVICMTESGVDSAGTVGKPVAGVEFKLADDGEILTRGRHVFVGYYKDDTGTANTKSADGWLQTGDLGEWTDKGLLRIRGRKKEVLKTSGGKMIAPLPIEERLKAADIVSQVCMVGDGRKYLSALITLSETKLKELEAQKLLSGPLVTFPSVVQEVRDYVDQVNRELASFEQIKRFAILSREFSIVEGEMTPTLKMKRNVIEMRFKEVIDGMYSGGGASD